MLREIATSWPIPKIGARMSCSSNFAGIGRWERGLLPAGWGGAQRTLRTSAMTMCGVDSLFVIIGWRLSLLPGRPCAAITAKSNPDESQII